MREISWMQSRAISATCRMSTVVRIVRSISAKADSVRKCRPSWAVIELNDAAIWPNSSRSSTGTGEPKSREATRRMPSSRACSGTMMRRTSPTLSSSTRNTDRPAIGRKVLRKGSAGSTNADSGRAAATTRSAPTMRPPASITVA
ncbi:MAG: hypothetical protein MUF32_06990, partial [Burkholderiaceae bacterium]|nr:hypothetical protein [Burkholderiaceae bacterium]